jgi:ParB family chromosome partitioning protein
MSTNEVVQDVPLDKIIVPRERVTSVWDPALAEEFIESVKSKGVLEPITLMQVDDELYLIDGLHRLEAVEKMGVKTIRAIIKPGTIDDLLLENIIRNRQRGKSNPSQEAEVLQVLVEKRGIPLETAAHTLGMTPTWAKKLLRIAKLPDRVKDLLKHGKIGVGSAVHISMLEDPTKELDVANDAAHFGYTEEQTKFRVLALLKEGFEPGPGEYDFTPEGIPSKVPIRCYGCGQNIDPGKTTQKYVWLCDQCLELSQQFFSTYWRPEPEPSPAQPTSSTRTTQPPPPQGT